MNSPTLKTPSGRSIEILNPKFGHSNDALAEIAYGLARVFRFGGNAYPYSVAQHSVLVSRICSKSMSGLLHDASEAYLGDIPKPLKNILHDYQTIEHLFMESIAMTFGLNLNFHTSPEVHAADKAMYHMECKYLNVLRGKGYGNNVEIFPEEESRFSPAWLTRIWTPEESVTEFVTQYNRILRHF